MMLNIFNGPGVEGLVGLAFLSIFPLESDNKPICITNVSRLKVTHPYNPPLFVPSNATPTSQHN